MNVSVTTPTFTGDLAPYETGRYKWYVAAVLCAAHTVAIIDRFLMVLVTEPIRAQLHLSDTQLGLLQGTGFALLYCGFAVPLGAVADATNRRNLIVFGLTIWSLATAAAAFATSFATLFASRILVGMGEACLVPAGMSLLAAYFAPANLARGTAVFGLGANFGYGAAFLGGSAILAGLQASGGLFIFGTRFAPWESVFLFAGLLAAPVAVFLAFVREPPRQQAGAGLGRHVAAFRDGLGHLRSNLRSYAPFLVVGAATSITGYAVTSWSSSLFVRTQGLSPTEAGRLIGLIGLIAGPLGTIAGGYVLDKLRAQGVAGAPLVIMAAGSIVSLIAAGAVGYAPNVRVAAVLFGLFVFESTFVLPSLYVGMQLLTPNRYRGIAASFNMMTYTLAGLGLGPTAVGIISDHLPGSLGLAHAIVAVDLAMVLIIVPTALLARRAFQAHAGSIGA